MKILQTGAALTVAISALAGHAANAATISEDWVIDVSAEAAGAQDGGAVQAPTASHSASKTTTKGGDVITAEAFQNKDGVSRVSVDVMCDDVETLACGGYADETTAKARAYRQLALTNTGTSATDFGVFDFRISGVELEVFNGGGFGSGPPPVIPEANVSFSAFAQIGFSPTTPVDQFDAMMTLTGRYNDFRIENASGFSGTVQRQECFDNTCLRGFVPVDPLSGSLNIGILQPGETAVIVTELIVDTKFAGYEIGARASAADPNGASYSSYSFGPPPAPVPVPATGLLLLSGLVSVGAMRSLKGRRAGSA